MTQHIYDQFQQKVLPGMKAHLLLCNSQPQRLDPFSYLLPARLFYNKLNSCNCLKHASYDFYLSAFTSLLSLFLMNPSPFPFQSNTIHLNSCYWNTFSVPGYVPWRRQEQVSLDLVRKRRLVHKGSTRRWSAILGTRDGQCLIPSNFQTLILHCSTLAKTYRSWLEQAAHQMFDECMSIYQGSVF